MGKTGHNTNRAVVMMIMIGAAFFLFAPSSSALTFPPKPDSANWYVDEAGLIDSADATALNDVTNKLFVDQDIPLYVVTVNSLGQYGGSGDQIEYFAQALFDEWGIGDPERNYGILLLVSKNDRKARIELGADWAHNYDSDAARVMNLLIVPQFKGGYFSAGILDGVRGLDAMARGLDLPQPTAPWWMLPLMVGIGILLVALIYNLFKTGRAGWAWALIIGIGMILLYAFISGGRGGGSSGGFGGGFSGGGGATGSW